MHDAREVVTFCDIPESEIASKECRFATYVPSPEHGMPDLHVIKEIIHTKDGRSIPNLRLEYDRERFVWTTRKGFRNHNQYKENEEIEKLTQLIVTEATLDWKVQNNLGIFGRIKSRRDLFKRDGSQFIYGADISSTAIVKKDYQRKWNVTTPYTVTELDIEANIVDHDINDAPITMVSISMKEKLVTFVDKSYLAGFTDPIQRIEELTRKYLGEHLIKRNIVPELIVTDGPIDTWRQCFKRVHEMQPDFLSIWNILYELGNLQMHCDEEGIDIRDIVCDPRIPKEYQYFDFRIAPPIRVMASGKTMPVKVEARWHKTFCTASFYLIDQMCVYKQTRAGVQEESSYKLEAIMQKELGFGKLNIPIAENVLHGSPDWHIAMQKNHKLEYVVYNRMDVLGPELIDEKVKDLSHVMPSMAGTSDFMNFASQPRRVVDRLHWYVLEEKDRVMGITSSEIVDEYDDDTLGREDWIVALPAALITNQGLCIVKELPGVPVRIYKDTGDLDVSAAYPHGEVALNTSKETTLREPISFGNIPEDVFRMQNMGLSSGHVNAVDYCVTMMGFPTHHEMLGIYLEENKDTKLVVDQNENASVFRQTDYEALADQAPKLDYSKLVFAGDD